MKKFVVSQDDIKLAKMIFTRTVMIQKFRKEMNQKNMTNEFDMRFSSDSDESELQS